ncbi:hypothetical protein BDA99DRAFT_502935 [Phascolomyces articulosus]|uniref:Uncharacterized protein n=1 Tax=Phascolomyces articulosus TaxID=60185 RepID=A0AAD5K493_9FUNG|nr:hypothetical protein BDA99DRAFT_502935 [Phascolomyces articulosus]
MLSIIIITAALLLEKRISILMGYIYPIYHPLLYHDKSEKPVAVDSFIILELIMMYLMIKKKSYPFVVTTY